MLSMATQCSRFVAPTEGPIAHLGELVRLYFVSPGRLLSNSDAGRKYGQ